MHIKVAQKDLENAANVVSSMVDRGAGPLPVLGNLLIEARDGRVHFRGTDIESLVMVNLNAQVVREGRTTIPADTFRDIVKVLPPQGEVEIEEDGRKVVVSCDTNEYKLMTLPAEDFPEWPSETGATRIQIAQRKLKELIDATAYALPSKDHRRVLLGVYFELNDNTLRLTATDGKKLSRVITNIPEVDGASKAAIVVPRKLLDNLAKNLGNEGPVEIEFSARQVVFRFDNIVYRCNGIEGKYPDCDAVIPKEFPLEVPLNRDIFLQASRRAGIVTDDKNKSIILKFEDGVCHFQSMAHDLGTFKGRIAMEYKGPTIELAFNYQFLNETLGKFGKPELRMFIKNATAPVVFKSADDDNRLSLLMPIKLSDIRPAAPAAEEEGEEQ